VRAAVAAIRDGLGDVRDHPEAAAEEITRAAGSKDVGLTRAQLAAVEPVFAPGLRLDRAVLERWADFDARIGIVKSRPDVDRAFDFTVAG